LKLSYVKLLSNFAFKCNLRLYSKEKEEKRLKAVKKKEKDAKRAEKDRAVGRRRCTFTPRFRS